MATALTAGFFLCLVGACAGVVFLAEESLGRWWARTHELRRWLQLKLDSIATVAAAGQYHSPNLDSDGDLESGFAFGKIRDSSVEGGIRTLGTLQKPGQGGPIRRSVHRGGQNVGGTPVHTSTSPPTEYTELNDYPVHGGLFEDTSDRDEQQQQQLPRPAHGLPRHVSAIAPLKGPSKAGSLTTTLSTEEGASSGEVPRVLKPQRRGASFDAEGIGRREAAGMTGSVGDCAPSSARGNFAFPHTGARNDVSTTTTRGSEQHQILPDDVVAAFGEKESASHTTHRQDSGKEQTIPAYVPLKRLGSLSQATHRRSTSRSSGTSNDMPSGLHSGYPTEANTVEESRRRSGSPPHSPFIAVKSPARILPPVPAFNSPALPKGPPAPPPPSLTEEDSHQRGSRLDNMALPPAYDSLKETAVQAGRWGADGGMHDAHVGGVSAQVSQGETVTNVAAEGDSGHSVTTPRRGAKSNVTPAKDLPNTPRISPECPSPTGDGHQRQHDELRGAAGTRMDRFHGALGLSLATENLGNGSPVGVPSSRSPSFWNEETTEVRVQQNTDSAPPSPSNVWMAGTAVHGGGTGVRRRMSPRAGYRPAEPVGGGWAPVSPPREEVFCEMPQRYEERSLSPDEVVLQEAECSLVGVQERKISAVGDEQKSGSTGVNSGASGREEKTALDGESVRLLCSAQADAGTPREGAERADASIKAGDVAAAADVNASAACVSTERAADEAVGLRCSAPIYDRGRNLLGNAEGAWGRGEESGREPTPEMIPDVPTLPSGACTPERRAADVRAEDDGLGNVDPTTDDLLPTVAPESAQKLAQTQDAEGDAQQQRNVRETRERTGRDLSSADAFAQSLDLPFEELELTKLIGGGGFGQVYRGLWRGTPVAVKVLVPVAQRDLDDDMSTDFSAEVQMLAALRHPNVCLFMGACVAPPNRAIVTELVSRGSLWEVLRDDNLPSDSTSIAGLHHGLDGFRTPGDCWPWSAIVKVAEGVACGMNYLHRHEPSAILHRDLKSANLLLDDSFNVKICDFGLARLKAFTNSMTGNCGTVQWMAPEVLASEKYTETADVYSFGIVCWELLARACPYEGMSQIQVAVAVLNNSLRPEIPAWCPPQFSMLIQKSWDQDPTNRPSFGEVLDFIRRSPRALHETL